MRVASLAFQVFDLHCVAAIFDYASVGILVYSEPLQAYSETPDFVVVSIVKFYRIRMDSFPYVSPI